MITVKDFNIFIRECIPSSINILFLGKGPSFSLLDRIKLDSFYTVCLNHTILNVDKCDICSIIDIENFIETDEVIYNKAKYVAMPWRPHMKAKNFKPTEKTILDFAKENIYLQKIIDESRLLLYNTNSAAINNFNHAPDVSINDLYINNGDSLFGMFCKNLIRSNNKVIYSLGIDGGNVYADQFSDLEVGGEVTGVGYCKSIEVINNIEKSANYKMIYLKDILK
tara:strand:- start:3523 stop:4194 length:672 start_codon:yes stop_codon:yes gene_type:complete